ncbi:MAG: D-alanyl-D-alanine carboxypeptidase family protein [Clostridiales bacterium]|nr:D-alanyl-D-alanine carboxypeptidase family protein [Clostridiales bacterium]
MFNINDWNLILVNSENALPKNFSIELKEIKNMDNGNTYLLDNRIILYLFNMFNFAQRSGITLNIFSGYRDIFKQIDLLNNSIKKHRKEKRNINEAQSLSLKTIALPGFSEHHTGLAIDIYSNQTRLYDNISFENTYAFRWLKNNSYRFGFILRYPKDKSNITNISFEPWHYRFVGYNAAKYMYDNNLCLEEFIEKISKN